MKLETCHLKQNGLEFIVNVIRQIQSVNCGNKKIYNVKQVIQIGEQAKRKKKDKYTSISAK